MQKIKPLIAALLLTTSFAYAQNATPRHCGSELNLNELRKHPEQFQKHLQLEQFTNDYLKANVGNTANKQVSVTVPVVFHILYKFNSDTTGTAAHIQQQMDTLNACFNATNPMFNAVPKCFKNVGAGFNLNFQLAHKGDNGEYITGIDYRKVASAVYTKGNTCKQTSTNGIDALNTDKYFNIWVVTRLNETDGSEILANTTFPLETGIQGIVIRRSSLGNTTDPSFNQGKTLVHETGHFFNLEHPGTGLSGATCGTDNITDTPKQFDESLDESTQFFPTYSNCADIIDNTLITKYNTTNTPAFAANSSFQNIEVDGNNNVWAGTNGQGLYRFDGSNWAKLTGGSLDTHQVRDIIKDNDGKIWIASGGGGITAQGGGVRFFPNNDFATVNFYSTTAGLSSRFVNDLAVDNQNNIWAALGQDFLASIGLTHEGSVAKFTRASSTWNTLNTCMPASDRRVLNIANDVSQGFNQPYFFLDKSCPSVPCAVPAVIATSTCGQLNFTTLTASGPFSKALYFHKFGYSFFGLNNGKLYIQNAGVTTTYNLPNGASVSPNCIKEDPYGNVWMATNGGGIMIFAFRRDLTQLGTINFTDTVSYYLNASNGLPSDNVTGFAFDAANNLWITTPTQVVKIPSYLAFGNMYFNFMDYSKDKNLQLFTDKQHLRAEATWQAGMPREELTTHPDLLLDGDCIFPQFSVVQNITSTTATVSWDIAPSGKTKIRYRVKGATNWNTSIASKRTNTFTLTGLVPNTTYQYQLKSYCDNNTVSAFSPSVQFKTKVVRLGDYQQNDAVAFDVNIFPNPSSSDFTFEFNEDDANNYNITISDVSGRIIETYSDINTQTIVKAGEHLSNGVYFATVKSSTNQRTLKIIKTN